jgi:RimJ/RimL family protein N-acetyltransferase
MPGMIKNWLRRRLGVDEAESDDDLEDEERERGLLVRKGQLVALRTHVSANREAFQRWYGDPEIAELLRHDLEPLNDQQSRGYFDTFILPASARGFCFAIHERRSKRLIGTTALTDRTTSKDGTSALFRIVIGEKDAWGKGFGTEATRLVMEEAFESLGLDEVRLEVFGHNARAIATYQRVGFDVVGEHVEWVPRRKVELRVIEMRLKRQIFEATAGDWGPSKQGSASRSGEKDHEQRAARRELRATRRAQHEARRANPRRAKVRESNDSVEEDTAPD